MPGVARSPTGRRRLGLPRPTARLRLTCLYSGMFLLLGTAVIVITFLLTSQHATIGVSQASSAAPVSRLVTPFGQGSGAVVPSSGVTSGIHDVVVRQHSADVRQLLGVSWVVLAVTAVLSTVLGWFIAGRVLRPLREMTASARTITAGSLGERLALTGPDDEFKQLGDTLDDLLARLEASFEAQRRFVANASHELRTPLTLERTLLQVALADPNASATSLRATCEELLSAGREQERLLEALLTLASSERGLDDPQQLDLAVAAERALAAAGAEVDRRGLELHTALALAPIAGDPALVQRLAANLVDNAVRHNVAGGRVEIRTGTDGGRALLTVLNTGPVVAAEDVERLFEPFQRLGDGRGAHADGHHGLGLSIVRAIASAHGATVTIEARRGGGLEVMVSLPAAPLSETRRGRTPTPPAETPATAH
jgi:signal transduction histidine kinase